MSSELVSDVTARFLNPSFLALFKGFTLTTVAPIVIIVILTVLAVNIIASLLADSPGPYPHFGKRLATAAADIWDNRNQYGFLNGRLTSMPLGQTLGSAFADFHSSKKTLDSLGPLENVLDAISESVKKWEDAPLYNASGSGTRSPVAFNNEAVSNNYVQQDAAGSAPVATYYQTSPQFLSNSESKSTGGKIRFQ